VSDLPNVQLNDEVELWGEQLPINEVAAYVGTIGYELMTRVSARVPRRYLYQPNSK
jgi:alanine racemase